MRFLAVEQGSVHLLCTLHAACFFSAVLRNRCMPPIGNVQAVLAGLKDDKQLVHNIAIIRRVSHIPRSQIKIEEWPCAFTNESNICLMPSRGQSTCSCKIEWHLRPNMKRATVSLCDVQARKHYINPPYFTSNSTQHYKLNTILRN
jgi:hypothetical protein